MTALMERPTTRPACAYCARPIPADDVEDTAAGPMHFGCSVDAAREASREALDDPGFDLFAIFRRDFG